MIWKESKFPNLNAVYGAATTSGRGSHVFGAITGIRNPSVMSCRNEQHSRKKQYIYLLTVLLLTETRKELEFSLSYYN